MKSKDDLFVELKKQQNLEFRRNLKLISLSKEEINKLKNAREKTNEIKKLSKIKKNVLSKIKKKQKEQIKVVKQLKKSGKESEISKKMREWKNEGYKMVDAEEEIKKQSDKNMKKQFEKFKKMGYKF